MTRAIRVTPAPGVFARRRNGALLPGVPAAALSLESFFTPRDAPSPKRCGALTLYDVRHLLPSFHKKIQTVFDGHRDLLALYPLPEAKTPSSSLSKPAFFFLKTYPEKFTPRGSPNPGRPSRSGHHLSSALTAKKTRFRQRGEGREAGG